MIRETVSMPFLTGSLLQPICSMMKLSDRTVSMPFLTGSLLQLENIDRWYGMNDRFYALFNGQSVATIGLMCMRIAGTLVSMPFLTGSLLQQLFQDVQDSMYPVSMPFLTGSLLQHVTDIVSEIKNAFLCPF